MARQHGVASLAQLLEIGLKRAAVYKRARCGRLHRVHQAVYSIAPSELLSLRGHFMAAVLACGPGAVLSHRSAAHLHGLRRTTRANVDVTTPGTVTHKHEGVDVHASTTLTRADTTIVDGIPCTTVARTALDLGDVVSTRAVERALEEGERMEIIDHRALNDQLERNLTRAAAGKLRQALASLRPGAGPTESQFEEDFLALCRRLGLPEPERQLHIDPGDGEPAVRADFAWPQHRLIVETDGGRDHRTRRQFEADTRKDQRLTLLDWRVVRITWRQLHEEPWRIERLVRDLLRRA
jgi:very-short-patch-repair endonuclease